MDKNKKSNIARITLTVFGLCLLVAGIALVAIFFVTMAKDPFGDSFNIGYIIGGGLCAIVGLMCIVFVNVKHIIRASVKVSMRASAPLVEEYGKMVADSSKLMMQQQADILGLGENKICPECDAKCNGDAKFCPTCGCKFDDTICPECGKANKCGAKFCVECGARLAD